MSIYMTAVHNHLQGMDADEKGMLSALKTGDYAIAQKAMMKFLNEFNLSLSCLQMAWSEKTKFLHGMFVMVKHEQEHQQKVDYDANYMLVREIMDANLPEQLGQDLAMLRQLNKSSVFQDWLKRNGTKLEMPDVLKKKTGDLKLQHKMAKNNQAQKASQGK